MKFFPNSNKNQLIWLAVLFVSLLFIGSFFDQSSSEALHGFGGPRFAAIMGQSVFEGDPIGFGDFGTLAIILGFLGYCFLETRAFRQESPLRPMLGYIAYSAIFVTFAIQGLKIALARPRPGLEFIPFWEVANKSPETWFGSGSFPSGHTAQIAMLLAYVYAIPNLRKTQRTMFALCVFFASMLMGFSRIASHKHWLTDTIASIGICWFLLHWIYYAVLNIPDQRAYLNHQRTLPTELSRFWELRLIFWAVLGILFLLFTAVFLREGHPIVAFLSVSLAFLSLKKWQIDQKKFLAPFSIYSKIFFDDQK